MKVVADTSPLIFLAKIRRLDLVPRLLGNDIRVARSVSMEALARETYPEEGRILEAFFDSCSVEEVRHQRRFALALSRADNDTLTAAVGWPADILLCDDRLVRMTAETEGVKTLGTLGLILKAMSRGFFSRIETRQLVDALVREHGFRISIEVYQAVIGRIELNGPRTSRSGHGQG